MQDFFHQQSESYKMKMAACQRGDENEAVVSGDCRAELYYHLPVIYPSFHNHGPCLKDNCWRDLLLTSMTMEGRVAVWKKTTL